jgi:hypothetical protein
MDLVGPLIGAAVAACISSIAIRAALGRHPFGDRRARALLLWLSVVGVDVAAFALFAGGYAAVEGVAPLRSASLVGWALAGAAVPLALRSPIREAEVAGTTRGVGITYVYDWVRAQLEVRLDGRLTELRRRDDRTAVQRLRANGVDFEALKGDIVEHFDEAQRLSADARIRIAAAIDTAATIEDVAQAMRALVRVARENQAGVVIERLVEPTADRGA